LSETALNDLRGIHAYIAEENPAAALEFIEDLAQKIEWIAASGFTGAPRDWIRPGLRILPYRDRCIYLRVTDDTVFIVRVLHSSQDVEREEF
jgi:toxin ParE1/3/4